LNVTAKVWPMRRYRAKPRKYASSPSTIDRAYRS
jgi:hypothetical protein